MKKTSFLIVGKHAVLEALKNSSRKIVRVFLTEDSQKKLNRENQSLNLFKNVPVFFKSRKELDNLCGKDETSHQGLVAEVEQLEELTLKEFVLDNKKKNMNLIALEEVTDPRNIGSIIRSAASFKMDGILVKERSFPAESKLLYKSASGCTELINIFEVTNLNTTIKYLKSKNFWVSGFDMNGEKNFTDNDWKGKNILLFGSESEGLKFQIKKNSDFLFYININKEVESLNVSNSASIVFHHINQKIENK